MTLEDGVLSVAGERKSEKEEKNQKFHRVERAYGSFLRSFTLPEDATKCRRRACERRVKCAAREDSEGATQISGDQITLTGWAQCPALERLFVADPSTSGSSVMKSRVRIWVRRRPFLLAARGPHQFHRTVGAASHGRRNGAER